MMRARSPATSIIKNAMRSSRDETVNKMRRRRKTRRKRRRKSTARRTTTTRTHG